MKRFSAPLPELFVSGKWLLLCYQEDERRDEMSDVRQKLRPSLRRVSIVVTWISAFSILDCGVIAIINRSIIIKPRKLIFKMTFKALISSLDES